MVARSEIIGFGPVPVAAIERLLCTADISRVVTRGKSEILDVGRTFRLATNAQRRALVIRSGGTCEWPGCAISHTWCDAHHLTPWEDSGPTDLVNLTQICKHHHRQFHHNNYVGINRPDGFHVYRPDGTEITTLLDAH